VRVNTRRLKFMTVVVAALAIPLLSAQVAFAASPKASAPLGNDISWPQCGQKLPTGQAFAIVGVNDGLANTTNPCLAAELAWAARSTGVTGQPSISLYVNTANPGLQGSWWPTSNTYRNTVVANPYGSCSGNPDAACAYVYGFAKAYDDVHDRGVTGAAGYLWWLDVETINTWSSDTAANAADLEGMTSYFQSIGARVGLYSTSYQWGQIVGNVSTLSNLNNLQSWIPGASSATAAKSKCAAAPLTMGSKVTLTQFVSNRLDYDYSCI
jgi:hypothetical protein